MSAPASVIFIGGSRDGTVMAVHTGLQVVLESAGTRTEEVYSLDRFILGRLLIWVAWYGPVQPSASRVGEALVAAAGVTVIERQP